MNVELVVPTISRQGGGVSEAVKNLVRLLKDEPLLKLSVSTAADSEFGSARTTWPGVPLHAFRVYGPKRYGFAPGLLMHLLKCRADVVHVHGIWMFHCLAVLIWSVATGKPYVVTLHGMLEPWILRRSKFLKWLVSKAYQSMFLRRASAIHVLTSKEQKDAADAFSSDRCVVIPNVIVPFKWSESKPSWWLPEYDSKKVFLFLGRIHEKKGWSELCRTWEQLCDDDPAFASSALLVFCGWIDGPSDFEKVVLDLKRRYKNVIYPGPQFEQEKFASLRAAWAFLLPSRSEGLPMVVLEAWTLGTPVLMTKECNLGIGFDRGAATDLGCTMSDMAAEIKQAHQWTPEQRDRMRRAALSIMDTEFSPAAIKAQMVQLYRAGARTSEVRP